MELAVAVSSVDAFAVAVPGIAVGSEGEARAAVVKPVENMEFADVVGVAPLAPAWNMNRQ